MKFQMESVSRKHKKLDQEQLKADLAASKSVNRYFEDFKKYNVAPEAAPESKQEQIKEKEVEVLPSN